VEISTELPGVGHADVKVSVEGQSVVISGEKKSESEKKDKAWRAGERSYGAFRRAAPLNFTPEAAKIKASFDKGVLRVTVGTPPEMIAKKVEIPIGKAG
jgi:HSP20 family protein